MSTPEARYWDRVRLLENVRLPKAVKLPSKYGSVSGGTMLAALRAIASFARDDPGGKLTLATIAGRMGKSKSSAKRAIQGLVKLDLLSVENVIEDGGYQPSEYQVCWPNIQDRQA